MAINITNTTDASDPTLELPADYTGVLVHNSIEFMYFIDGLFWNRGKFYTAEDWFNSLSEDDKLEALFRIPEWR